MRVHLKVLLIAALLAGTSVGQGPPAGTGGTEDAGPSKAEKLFTEGRDALFQSEYKQAIELLGQAVDLDKTKTSYRMHLARAYYYSGQTKKAAEHLKKILEVSPEHVESGQLLGQVYAKDQDWGQVVKTLEPLLKYRHDYPTYHFLAEAEYNLNDYKKARKYFEKAVQFNDKNASDHYQLGNVYLSGNFFALAAESYQRALGLGLDSPVLRYKLASAYFNLRNYFGKIAQVTVKAGKEGTISGNWYLIEAVPGKKKRETFLAAPANSAIYQVAKAIADGIQDSPDIHFLRANIYLNARRYRQANRMFKKLQAKIPKEDKALFYYYYAKSAFGLGQYKEYLDLLNKAIELDRDAYQSTLVDAYQKIAEQYNQAGELGKYIEYLIKAVGENPQTASLHLKLGHAYEEVQQYDKAIVQWRMVLDLEPDHPKRMELLNLIGKYRRRLAEPSEPAIS